MYSDVTLGIGCVSAASKDEPSSWFSDKKSIWVLVAVGLLLLLIIILLCLLLVARRQNGLLKKKAKTLHEARMRMPDDYTDTGTVQTPVRRPLGADLSVSNAFGKRTVRRNPSTCRRDALTPCTSPTIVQTSQFPPGLLVSTDQDSPAGRGHVTFSPSTCLSANQELTAGSKSAVPGAAHVQSSPIKGREGAAPQTRLRSPSDYAELTVKTPISDNSLPSDLTRAGAASTAQKQNGRRARYASIDMGRKHRNKADKAKYAVLDLPPPTSASSGRASIREPLLET